MELDGYTMEVNQWRSGTSVDITHCYDEDVDKQVTLNEEQVEALTKLFTEVLGKWQSN